MVTAFFLILAFGLALAVAWGHRYNEQRARFFLRVIEAQFQPESTEYVALGRGLGYGFDMRVPGAITEVQGVLTLLPRYTPLYLPIARFIGRRDLVKLTFHCRGLLAAGVGAIVHTSCHGSRWSTVEADEDWREESVELGGRSYALYFYNPSVAERLRSIIPELHSVAHLNQFSIDSRTQRITIFVTPNPRTFRKELQDLVTFIFFLTAA